MTYWIAIGLIIVGVPVAWFYLVTWRDESGHRTSIFRHPKK